MLSSAALMRTALGKHVHTATGYDSHNTPRFDHVCKDELLMNEVRKQ